MPNNRAYIIAAYVITWVAILGYYLYLYRARKEADRRFQRATHMEGK